MPVGSSLEARTAFEKLGSWRANTRNELVGFVNQEERARFEACGNKPFHGVSRADPEANFRADWEPYEAYLRRVRDELNDGNFRGLRETGGDGTPHLHDAAQEEQGKPKPNIGKSRRERLSDWADNRLLWIVAGAFLTGAGAASTAYEKFRLPMLKETYELKIEQLKAASAKGGIVPTGDTAHGDRASEAPKDVDHGVNRTATTTAGRQGARMPQIQIGDGPKRITHYDLMGSEKTVAFRMNRPSNQLIFRMEAEQYHLELGLADGAFYLTRNGNTARQPFMLDPKKLQSFIAYWGPTILLVDVNGSLHEVETAPTLPPNSLVRWAREQNILPQKNYDDELQLHNVVLAGLQGLQDKVESAGTQKAFWDFTYEGKAIRSRTPKNESAIQPTIHALLFDLANAKGLDIERETAAGGGALDFLYLGAMKAGGVGKVCVELKHAHAANLDHGLVVQLPAYMEAKACSYGIYCVLYFRGNHFDKPPEDRISVVEDLEKKAREAGLANSVRIVVLDFGFKDPPSTR